MERVLALVHVQIGRRRLKRRDILRRLPDLRKVERHVVLAVDTAELDAILVDELAAEGFHLAENRRKGLLELNRRLTERPKIVEQNLRKVLVQLTRGLSRLRQILLARHGQRVNIVLGVETEINVVLNDRDEGVGGHGDARRICIGFLKAQIPSKTPVVDERRVLRL